MSTPMLKQYHERKSRHKDTILFFRLGDFYEMFYDDAVTASKILDLVLTSRGKDASGKIPMCGIPYHSAESYIKKLIKAGKKVAICEQVEDPKASKGIVKREVTRIITSGTYIDDDSGISSTILSLFSGKEEKIYLSFVESEEGKIYVSKSDTESIRNFITKISPSEIIYPEFQKYNITKLLASPYIAHRKIPSSPYHDWAFNEELSYKALCEHFKTASLRGFGIAEPCPQIAAAGAILEYLKEMNKTEMKHIKSISPYNESDFLYISAPAYSGLDIDSLVNSIDFTSSKLGKKRLRKALYSPLKDTEKINERLSAVEILYKNDKLREKLGNLLSQIPDIEKNLSKLGSGYLKPRDLLSIRNTLEIIPSLKELLSKISEKNGLFAVKEDSGLASLLARSINPEMPLTKNEGKVIKRGFSKELDELKDIKENTEGYLRKLQAEEIKKSGINSLKIGFNKVFGYYFEISKANLNLTPPHFIRKQTLVNAERFITEELKEFEEKILKAEGKILELETKFIKEISEEVIKKSEYLLELADELGTIDMLASMAQVAKERNYTKPEVNNGTSIIIKNGRHPVVENFINTDFTPNDLSIDTENERLLIITGPNMSGKSTYIRQNGLITIMAQAGSFVPAERASIGIVDRIYTRIGAHDELEKGQSTFMVEMSETAEILNNITSRSFVILDEIGRGTSTYDGLSLAWAIAEHLQKSKIRAMFATHFHEITVLEQELEGVKNYNVEVKEWNDEVIFMHKIIPGSADDSYGIYVAKLAGIPKNVTKRAKSILNKLEFENNLTSKIRKTERQLPLFEPSEEDKTEKHIITEIKNIDLNNLTPIDALNTINNWKRLCKDE